MFYRPIWISGRYDANTHSAIIYNLVSGISYFFEDVSADVMSYVLDTGRNKEINISQISIDLDLTLDDLRDFLQELSFKGVINNTHTDDYALNLYREEMAKSRQRGDINNVEMFEEKEDAEQDYLNRTNTAVFSLLIELTYRCSENCIHCYNPGASRNSQENNTRNNFVELKLDEYKKIIDDFYEQGLVRVCLSGGDPFSKPIIWEIIEYLHERDIVFDIYTNGQLLYGNEEKLANYFPCSIGLSIYSDLPDVHDTITRVKGSLDKTIKVLDKITSLSVPVSIKCCVMRNNYKSYRGVSRLAKKYASALQIDCNVFDSVDGDACASSLLRLSKEALKIILRDKDTPLYVGPELNDFGAKPLPKNRNACSAGYSGFCLTPDGNLTLCVSFPSTIGNLRTNDLRNILSDPNLLWWKKQKLTDYDGCGSFDYCDYCGLCPGLNFSKNGTPLKPCDNNCFVAQVRKEVADLLKNNHDPLNGKSVDEALKLLPEEVISAPRRIQERNFYGKKINRLLE